MDQAQADTEYEVTGTPEDADNLAKLLSENGLSIADAVLAVANSLAKVEPVVLTAEISEPTAEEMLKVLVGAEKTVDTQEVKKGLYDVSQLAQTLQTLFYLATSAKAEAEIEGDNSDIPARLDAVAKTVAEIYKDMATEEADELVASSGADVYDDTMQMAYGLTASLAKASKNGGAVDTDTMQKMHDLSTKLGAKCATPAAKSEEAGDLAKVEKPAAEDMQKMLADAIEPLNKALGDAMAKIAVLEAQPTAPKGVLRVVSKENDTVVEIKKVEVAPVVERDGTVNDVASALKKVHSSGGAPLINLGRRPVI